MGQALYRKYRSKSLAEIIGQEHITTALNNSLRKGSISHAYLFTGPRGVGKTSIARILAHEVNGLPYDETATHLDIIEIDAASNRRIDEIRELRERVHSAPTSAKYKVYIIDEVHMLTKEAFNALLKTLEEPPAHAIFILATTESHKLPETIISRTQRYTFRPIDPEQAISHLESIAKSENITISREALELIAQHGGGSFRDSISLLDQASNAAATIGLQEVQIMLGIAPDELIDSLIDGLAAGDLPGVVAYLRQLHEQGFNAAMAAKQLSARLRGELLNGNGRLEPGTALSLLDSLLNVQASHDPATALELALLGLVIKPTTRPTTSQQTVLPESIPEPKKAEPKTTSSAIKSAPAPHQVVPPEPSKVAKTAEPKPTTPKAEQTLLPAVPNDTGKEELWQRALAEIKKTHNTLYSVARMAEVTTTDNEITLAFGFPFHHKRMNDAKNKQVMLDILQRLAGEAVSLECVLAKDVKTAKPMKATNNHVDTISNIFGSAEVLE